MAAHIALQGPVELGLTDIYGWVFENFSLFDVFF